MQRKPATSTATTQGDRPQVIDSARKFASASPVIESVAERIAYRWSQGALERHLSIEYRTRRAFIEAVLRREFNRLRAENVALRMEQRRAA